MTGINRLPSPHEFSYIRVSSKLNLKSKSIKSVCSQTRYETPICQCAKKSNSELCERYRTKRSGGSERASAEPQTALKF